MPDVIAALRRDGKTFLLTANEGDVREWEGIKGPGTETEAARAASAALEGALPAGVTRLNVTTVPGLAGGDTDGDGLIECLESYGARSFTVWSTSGKVVFDSGDDLEQIDGLDSGASASTPATRTTHSTTGATTR